MMQLAIDAISLDLEVHQMDIVKRVFPQWKSSRKMSTCCIQKALNISNENITFASFDWLFQVEANTKGVE